MKLQSLVLAAGLLTASLASAQATLQRLQLAPTRPAADVAQIDQDAMARRSLEIENKKLRDEVARLEQENQALKRRVDDFTSLGGSEVHAYCANSTTSRNTAGAQADCSGAGYTCESVSGLCRDSCLTSDACSTGFSCEPTSHKCVYTADGTSSE